MCCMYSIRAGSNEYRTAYMRASQFLSSIISQLSIFKLRSSMRLLNFVHPEHPINQSGCPICIACSPSFIRVRESIYLLRGPAYYPKILAFMASSRNSDAAFCRHEYSCSAPKHIWDQLFPRNVRDRSPMYEPGHMHRSGTSDTQVTLACSEFTNQTQPFQPLVKLQQDSIISESL